MQEVCYLTKQCTPYTLDQCLDDCATRGWRVVTICSYVMVGEGVRLIVVFERKVAPEPPRRANGSSEGKTPAPLARVQRLKRR